VRLLETLDAPRVGPVKAPAVPEEFLSPTIASLPRAN